MDKIEEWREIVKAIIDCMGTEQLEYNFNLLLSESFYKSFRNREQQDIRFGQYVWNNLSIGGIVSCSELFYEVDEERVKDFVACFLFEAGLNLNKG